jgi:hypothetical protein
LCFSAVEPPPLTDEQVTKLRELVKVTQARANELKDQLDVKQMALSLLYAEYKLDTPRAEKLQSEIVDLQKQLLANYHRLHVELRDIVGEERFQTLRQRLDRILAPTAPKPQ